MNKAIRIKLKRTEKSQDSLSHLFGAPIVPKSLFDNINNLDSDVMFFGQLDLAEIAAFDDKERLVHSGILYLFLDTAVYPYKAISFYSTDEPIYIIDDFNSQVPEFEDFVTPFAVSFENCDEYHEGTKLFGKPSWDIIDKGELFMQFDPLDNDTGFLSEIDGYAFFMFGDGKKTPENIIFTIERS